MPYINSAVFYYALPQDSLDLVSLWPRPMTEAFLNRDIEAGPISLTSFLKMEGKIKRVRDLCVGVRDKSRSVLLFSTRPAEELHGERVSITSHTATSSQLLRILFKNRWNVTPHEYVSLNETSTASLIIGDPALKLLKSGQRYRYVYDLAEEWNTMTDLPFVFAVWGVHSDTEAEKIEQFGNLLETATNNGINAISEIAANRANDYMTRQNILDYLSGFFYRLTCREQEESIRLFGSLTEKLG